MAANHNIASRVCANPTSASRRKATWKGPDASMPISHGRGRCRDAVLTRANTLTKQSNRGIRTANRRRRATAHHRGYAWFMTEFLFYHLEAQPVEKVLPVLLEKSVERGWRVVVHTSSERGVHALEAHLWTFRDDSFLPHGRFRGRTA